MASVVVCSCSSRLARASQLWRRDEPADCRRTRGTTLLGRARFGTPTSWRAVVGSSAAAARPRGRAVDRSSGSSEVMASSLPCDAWTFVRRCGSLLSSGYRRHQPCSERVRDRGCAWVFEAGAISAYPRGTVFAEYTPSAREANDGCEKDVGDQGGQEGRLPRRPDARRASGRSEVWRERPPPRRSRTGEEGRREEGAAAKKTAGQEGAGEEDAPAKKPRRRPRPRRPPRRRRRRRRRAAKKAAGARRRRRRRQPPRRRSQGRTGHEGDRRRRRPPRRPPRRRPRPRRPLRRRRRCQEDGQAAGRQEAAKPGPKAPAKKAAPRRWRQRPRRRAGAAAAPPKRVRRGRWRCARARSPGRRVRSREVRATLEGDAERLKQEIAATEEEIGRPAA